MNSEEKNLFEKFLSSYNAELLSKVSRLDEIVGRDHWLSVGNYKESILRSLISNMLPRKYEVSTGFIFACDKDGKLLKSQQIDIIVWDSVNYAPLFRDGEFVIVPPEACSAVIEVKGKLTADELKDGLSKIDSITKFYLTDPPAYKNICKYIFAYDIDKKLRFPNGLWQLIANSYRKNIDLPLEERMYLSNKSISAQECWNPLFSVDAIFVLPSGAIKREVRWPEREIRFLFIAYLTASNSHNHTYAYFESLLQAHLVTNGRSNLLHAYQPGLFSFKQKLSISPASPQSLMVFPPLERESMFKDIGVDKDHVFVPKDIS